jgi:hypothetical protein
MAFISCSDEETKTVFKEINEISIAQFSETDEIEALILEQLEIEPVIEQSIDKTEDDLSFVWFLFQKDQTIGKADTISRDRNLSYQISLVPGTYLLKYRVTDNNTKVFAEQEVMLEVQNIYTSGLVVLNEVSNEARIAFINFNLNEQLKDVYLTLNGTAIGTNPKWISQTYYGEFVIACNDDNGGVFCSTDDFRKESSFVDKFFEVPIVLNQNAYFSANPSSFARGTDFIINNNKIHKRKDDGRSTGEFKFYSAFESDLELSGFSVMTRYLTLGYDNNHKGFIHINSNSDNLSVFRSYGDVDWGNYGRIMVHGETNKYTHAGSYMACVFYDEATDKYYATEIESEGYSMFLRNDYEIDATSNIADATHFTNSTRDAFIYYSVGSKLYVIVTTSGEVREVADFGKNIDAIAFEYRDEIRKVYVAISDGPDKGTIVELNGNQNGTVEEETRYENLVGRVVDMLVK